METGNKICMTGREFKRLKKCGVGEAITKGELLRV